MTTTPERVGPASDWPAGRHRAPSLRRNIFSTYVARAVTVLVSFLLFPLVASRVGLTMLGLWLFVNSLTIFFALDFGLSTALVRYVADADARSDRSALNRYASSIFAVLAGVAVVGSAVFVMAILIFWPSLDVPPQEALKVVLMIGAAVVSTFLVSLPLGVFRLVIAGVDRYDIVNLLTVIQAALRLMVVLGVLGTGAGIVGVVLAEAAVSVSVSVGTVFVCRRLVPDLRIARRDMSAKTVRSLAPFAGPVFVMQLAALVILQVDNVVIGAVLSTASVALYTGAFRLYQVCREVTNSLTAPLIPEASRRSAAGEREVLGGVLVTGTKCANALMLLIAVPLVVFAPEVLTGWAGREFAAVTHVLQVLLIGLVINNNHLVAMALMTGIGAVHEYARYHVIWAVANLLLSVLLARRFGLIGVALGTTLPLLVLEPFYIRTALRSFGLSPRAFLVPAVGRVIVTAVVAGAPLAVAVTVWPTATLFDAIVLSSMWGVVFTAAFVAFGLEGSERERIWLSTRRKLPAVVGVTGHRAQDDVARGGRPL